MAYARFTGMAISALQFTLLSPASAETMTATSPTSGTPVIASPHDILAA
ncbi:hypothetical protein N7E70_015750 [Aminobacter sp. NyZ550]|nr:hypothetical protein [Aminobacter sp. NyZ550]WAX93151.1 hypothetical protein N7E70_015750 [Aminobacter sp. NyZ550]